jgi:hypothetical protein
MKFNVLVAGLLAMWLFHPVTKPHANSIKPHRVVTQDALRTVHVLMVGLNASNLAVARTAIMKVPGVISVRFFLPKQEAQIQLNVEKTNLTVLRKSIEDAGFTPGF